MLDFITTNWMWIVLIGAMVVMHISHGGHGGHGEKDSDSPMTQPSGERRY